MNNLYDDPAQTDRIHDLAGRIRTWQEETGDTLALHDAVGWVSCKALCHPERLKGLGSEGWAVLPGRLRFFGFAQNDSNLRSE